MARKGQGMPIPTTRSAYTDPNRNGYPRIATRAPRSAVGGGGGAGPLYGTKLGGIAERQQFSDVAAQASMDNQLAVVAPNHVPYYAGRAARAVGAPWEQTVLHSQIRDRRDARAQEAYEFDQRQMMDLARMAIEGNFRQAELQLRAMGMDEQVRQFDESRSDRNFWGSVDATQRDTAERRQIADRATDRAQRGYEFEETKDLREQEIAARTKASRRTARQRSAVAANKSMADKPGYWQNQAIEAGYDLSGFDKIDGSGEGARNRFDDTVSVLYSQNPNADPNDIIRQAAAKTGLQLREGLDAPNQLDWDPPQRRGQRGQGKRSASGATAPGPPPPPTEAPRRPLRPGEPVPAADRAAAKSANDKQPQRPLTEDEAMDMARREGLTGGKAVLRAVDLQRRSGVGAPTQQRSAAGSGTSGKPPVAGARQAKDGQWYVQDENGRWSRVVES